MLTADQHARRKQGIGASEVGAILGLSKYKTALDVYMDKLGLTEPSEDSEAAEWGHRLEPVIAQKYQAQYPGVLLEECDTRAHPDHPWALATPDRLAYDAVEEWLVEIKTREDRTAGEFGEPGTDQVPHDVLVQCQWQIFVTGKRRCDVALLVNGRRFSVYTIPADRDLQTSLRDQVQDFWLNHVLAQVPPDVTAQDNPTLARLFPKHTGETLEGTAEDFAVLQQIASLKAQVKALEKNLDQNEAGLKLRIGENAGLTFPNGSKVTWTKNKDSEVVDYKKLAEDMAEKFAAALSVDAADLLDGYRIKHTTTRPGARVLRLTVKEN